MKDQSRWEQSNWFSERMLNLERRNWGPFRLSTFPRDFRAPVRGKLPLKTSHIKQPNPHMSADLQLWHQSNVLKQTTKSVIIEFASWSTSNEAATSTISQKGDGLFLPFRVDHTFQVTKEFSQVGWIQAQMQDTCSPLLPVSILLLCPRTPKACTHCCGSSCSRLPGNLVPSAKHKRTI